MTVRVLLAEVSAEPFWVQRCLCTYQGLQLQSKRGCSKAKAVPLLNHGSLPDCLTTSALFSGSG